MGQYSKYITALIIAISVGVVGAPEKVFAQHKYAGKQRTHVARAHMSRARMLLVEALTEFEEARKYARPDLLLDSEDWRLRLVSLTEQLNRVIDPRPRVTREGAVFRVPPRFIRRKANALPEVLDGAYSRSDIGELARMKAKQEERAKMFEKKEAEIVPEEEALPLPELDELPAIPEESAKSEDLFTDDLLPQIPANTESEQGDDQNKEAISSISNEDEILVSPEGGFDQREAELSREEALAEEDARSILGGADGDDGESSTDEIVSEGGDSAMAKQAGSQDIDFNTIPGVISDEEVNEVSPEVAAKQLNEDEELARELEESISENLAN